MRSQIFSKYTLNSFKAGNYRRATIRVNLKTHLKRISDLSLKPNYQNVLKIVFFKSRGGTKRNKT